MTTNNTTPAKESPATDTEFELAMLQVFLREMGAYVDLLEQMGVRLARLERRVRQLEGAHHG